jgi:exodeoxyribonuclease-3
VLTHDEVRRAFRRICNLGVTDAFRLCHPNVQEFSWWDYRGGGFANDEGLRIDHLLVSPMAADVLKDCAVERSMRAVEKASDHAPVIGTF